MGCGATETYKCKCCGDPFTARVADRKRGWARYCSKSCKAIRQTLRTGIGAQGKPWRRYLPNGGYLIGLDEYDRHGMYVGTQMTTAELAMGGYGDADWDTPFGEGKF